MRVTQNRLELMATVQVDGVDEKDPLTSAFNEFSPTRVVGYHRVIEDEKRRPDLAAHREYASTRLWWFLLASNGIIDPYSLEEGVLIEVPQVLDFYDFVRAQRKSS